VEDFAALQVCFNGSNLPRNPLPQCARADSDGDGDVDVGDFAAFQVCFNGAARPPACRWDCGQPASVGGGRKKRPGTPLIARTVGI